MNSQIVECVDLLPRVAEETREELVDSGERSKKKVKREIRTPVVELPVRKGLVTSKDIVKFGEVQGVPRGTHLQGDFSF
jgi:hypothetical protein